ncbi:MAG: TIGR01459 family HAD-type hydrolase [Hyphomicrobiaceae bacterium]
MAAGDRAIPVLTSIEEIAGAYDVWVVDIWGVLHNGVTSFPAAVAACSRFRDTGGRVVLVSNAPRPSPTIQKQLDRLGVSRAAYDAMITSGDLTRSLIEERSARRVFHLGPERDRVIFADMPVELVELEAAELCVCSGLYDDRTETPEDYADMLARLKSRDMPMICANPDLVVEHGELILYCAGALAQAYEVLGGVVIYAGKPHPPVYERAFGLVSGGRPLSRERVLAIGDGVRTDIAGAARMGLSAVFIASRVHVDGPLEADLPRLFAGSAKPPIAAMTALVW